MKKLRCPSPFMGEKSKKKRADKIHARLKDLYPEAQCALEFGGDPWRLLVMARLSAQCTDKRVNEVSRPLFEKYPDVEAFASSRLEELEEAVRPCGLYRTKAKSIRDTARILTEHFGGEVPQDKETLLSLPGVGEKIANLMLGDVFGDPHIVADTHCIRLAGRLGLTRETDPSKVTRALEKIIPKKEQSDFCHRIILLGREYCRAQNPNCENCPMKNIAE